MHLCLFTGMTIMLDICQTSIFLIYQWPFALLTFHESWIAEEEVITGSGRCCLTSIWLENRIKNTTDFIHFIEDGIHTLLEETVSSKILTNVKVGL